jgi:peptidoglycan hydrolase-like protein with peptidoglycan-binding domain
VRRRTGAQAPSREVRRRALVPAVSALALVAAVVAYLVISHGSPGSPGGNDHRNKPLSGSTVVKRRNLIETDTESGTLSYASQQTVYNRLSGTITWLPDIGQLIDPGQPLFRIDNDPVWLMAGSTPAYRELDSSDSAGPDIYELNANLASLGYDPDGIVIDDQWQSATTAGIDALQKAYGQTETGSLPLGQVVFLPGPQLVGTVDGTVGSTGGGGGGSDASLIDPDSSTEFISLDTTTTTTGTATSATGTTTAATGTTTAASRTKTRRPHKSKTPTSAQQLQALLALLKAETAELNKDKGSGSKTPTGGSSTPSGKTTPSGGSTTPSGTDDTGASPVAILQTSSTQLVATVDLSASTQSEARIGVRVRVEMPNGSYVAGTITAVSPVAQSSSGNTGTTGGSGAAIPVTITLDKRVKRAGLDQAAVSVVFTTASAKHVLSVPVTALIATSGASFSVQEASPPYALIPVTTGLFAAGYVQISGTGIRPGLRVTDSQG